MHKENIINQIEAVVKRCSDKDYDFTEILQMTETLKNSGDYEQLDYLTRRVLETIPERDNALLLRAWYFTNIEFRYDDAENILSIVEDKDSVMYNILKASIYLHLHNEADAADEQLEKCCYGDAEERNEIILEAARMFVAENYSSFARKWLDMYPDKDNCDYLTLLAELEITDDNTDKAEDLYRKITLKDPFSVTSWNRLSYILIKKKDYEGALRVAEHAICLDPDNKQSMHNIELCRICLNRHNNRNGNITNQ